MKETRSFRCSDFSARDLPWFLAGYLLLAAFSVGAGLLIEALPEIWRGVLLGTGVGLSSALLLLFSVRSRPSSGKSHEP